MDSGQAFFLITDDVAAPFRPEAYLFTGFFQFRHVDDFLIGSGSKERRFIEQVPQVGTGKAGVFLAMMSRSTSFLRAYP